MSSWKSSIRTVGPLLLVAALLLSGSPTPGAVGAPSTTSVRSHTLASSPGLDRTADGIRYPSGAPAREQAARASAAVPLPAGGNLEGIRWETVGGALTAAEIDTVVQANAFCQWLRSARDGRDPESLDVLDDVPQWPGLRDQPDIDLLREVVAEAHAGGGIALDQVLADCDASHAREVDYAEDRGAPVPR